ncbi:MAG TPA: GNAT family N-acetyltransferase [Chloroflexia bacterium]|nr:GNAT family N-acetyltransferase [Chloroflexia bacterium]
MSIFDPTNLRSYNGFSDLSRILQFVGECNRLTDFCCSLHPGDVGHFLSNQVAGHDPAPYCFVYELSGEIEALFLFYAVRSSSWAMLVHPHRRTAEFEAALVEWAEQHLRHLLNVNGSAKEWLSIEVPDFDTLRRETLASRGYAAGPAPDFFLTTRPLQGEIPVPVLPEGFSIRAVLGEQEADAVQAVHAGSFGRVWQPGEYLEVMRSPGFQIDHELVVVAPDGRFAAFLVYWLDSVSKSGLFEPVGCHSDFQRRGLSKALMYEGMRRMVEQGMTTAVVFHEAPAENPASSALYRSVGFSPKYSSYEYRKKR